MEYMIAPEISAIFSFANCQCGELTENDFAPCIVRIYENISPSDFQTAYEEFKGIATILQENTIDNIRAVTAGYKNVIYNLLYDEIASELRLAADTSEFLPTLNPQEILSDSPVRLWQFETDHSLIDCGMCYIIQASDFRFFIIDSAHPYSVNDDIRIYQFLREHTPSGMKVTVAGWFFSHGHDDHTGKFVDILKYNNEIVIEGIYFNFVPEEILSGDFRSESDRNHVLNFYREIETHPEIPVYRLHSGMRFYCAGLCFDVLCTHEDVYPLDFDNYNDSSTVLMLTVGDDKVCFPADAGAKESAILERRYPSFLSCDIMQAAHHGHFGTSADFYRLAAADTVLFPTTRIKFDEEFDRYEANRLACSLAKHAFIASEGTVCFTFPLAGSVIELYPDETLENFEGVYNLWAYEYSDEYKAMLKEKFHSQQGSTIEY